MSTPVGQIEGNIKRENKKRRRHERIDMSGETDENLSPVIKEMLAKRENLREQYSFLKIEKLIEHYEHITTISNNQNISHSEDLISDQMISATASQNSSSITNIIPKNVSNKNFKRKEINQETKDALSEWKNKLRKYNLKIDVPESKLVLCITNKGREVDHLNCLANGFDIILDIVEEVDPNIYKRTTKQYVFENIFLNKNSLKNMQLFLEYSHELKNSKLDILKLLPCLKENSFTSFILLGILNTSFNEKLALADKEYNFSENFFKFYQEIVDKYGNFLLKDRKTLKKEIKEINEIKDDLILYEFLDFPDELRIRNMTITNCNQLIRERRSNNLEAEARNLIFNYRNSNHQQNLSSGKNSQGYRFITPELKSAQTNSSSSKSSFTPPKLNLFNS